MAILNNGQIIHFGSKYSQTYLDHQNEEKRINYFNRHYNNKNEKRYINQMLLSPAILSLFLLWGPYTDINDNLKLLNYVLSKRLDFNKNMILTKKYDKKINNYYND
jgi:hypothetical protein